MDQDLPWPECLGQFDEESCRFFLRELGLKVVQFYPFSVGMDEVYSQIMVTYGQDGAADVLSVLHELLEDESVALGSGDDGDIWRSWRHSWRHRNHDHLNPYLPRIHGRLLPQPTAVRTRLLKSANFLAAQSARDGQHRRYSTIEHVSSSTRCAENERDLLLDHHAPQPMPNVSAKSPRRSLPATVTKFPFPQVLLTPQKRASMITNQQMTDESPRRGLAGVTVYSPPRYSRPSPKKLERNQRPIHVPHRGEIEPLTTESGEPNIRSSSISEDRASSAQSTTCERRHTHRQARLIDGALFQATGGAARSETPKSRSPVKVMLEKTTKRLSAHTAKQQSQRDSWIHSIWTRFRGDCKQRHLDCSRHSSLSSHALDSPGHEKQPPAMTPMQRELDKDRSGMQQVLPPLRFGYDGAAEYMNKPLPCSPADCVARHSLSSETQRQFFQIPASLQGSIVTSPPASAASSGIDRFCQKLEFDGLVSATMSGPQELSPVKLTYESRASSSPRPSSFSSIAACNPYAEVSPIVNTHAIPAANYRQHTISSDIWPVRSNTDALPHHYDDAPQGGPRRSRLSIDESKADLRGQAAYDRDREHQARQPKTPETPTRRGRRGTDESTPPRTRSRSPMKRILGMMKSMSTNQIPSHKSTPVKDGSPQSNSKNMWKELSHKVRHGFLSADAEQLEQEELMEQHNCVSTIAAQSRVRRPAIISLDTAVQSRAYQELELLLVDNANLFLLDEYEHGRLARESILRSRRHWEGRNRPRVLEFIYDMQTQYELIMTNLRTLKLYGENAEDMIKLNSTLQQWRIMIREWPVKTLCMPDSVIRRWLQDSRRVLELIGASAKAMTCMDNLTISVYQVIRNKEHLRSQLRNVSSGSTATVHQRSFSDGQSFNIFQQGLGPIPIPLEPKIPPMPTFESSKSSGSRQQTPYEKSLAQIKQLEAAGAEAAAKENTRRLKEMRLKDAASRSRANTADSTAEPYSPSVVEARFVFDQNGEFRRR